MDCFKTCFRCEAQKPRSEFYKHKQMADGFLGKCKECTKSDVRTYRRSSTKAADYDAKRYRENPERRRKLAESVRERNARWPDKYAARTAVGNAVRDGRLAKPDTCSYCGTDCSDRGRIEAAHLDYSKPLDVIWLCSRCHRRMDLATDP